MTPLVESEIIEKLKQYSELGVPYFQAKENLLKAGYSDNDLKLVAYSYTYGEKPPEPDPVKQAMAKNPELAEKIAAGIADEMKATDDMHGLKELTKDDVINDSNTNAPEAHSKVVQVGLSWWLWLLVALTMIAVMLTLKSPIWYYGLVPATLLVIGLLRFFISKRRVQ